MILYNTDNLKMTQIYFNFLSQLDTIGTWQYKVKHSDTIDIKRYRMVQKAKRNNEVVVPVNYQNETVLIGTIDTGTILITLVNIMV